MAKQDKNQKEESKEMAAPVAPAKAAGKPPLSELKAFNGAAVMPNPGKLISRLDHAATISYNGEALVIPPRAQGIHAIQIADIQKLGALPAGIQLIK